MENSFRKFVNNQHFLSSWLGRQTYFGYYVDWLHLVFSVVPYCLIFTIIGSVFVGIYIYILAMVEDLQAILRRIEHTKPECMWPTYVNQIRFHNEICKYAQRLPSLKQCKILVFSNPSISNV